MITAKQIAMAHQVAGGLDYGLSEFELERLFDEKRQGDIQASIAQLEKQKNQSLTASEIDKIVKHATPDGWVSGTQDYALAAHYYRLLDNVILTGRRINAWASDRPLVSTRMSGDVTGFVTKGSDGVSVIILDHGITVFVHLLAKFFVDCCSSGAGVNRVFQLDPGKFSARIKEQENYSRIFQLLIAFCIEGNPAKAQQYYPREDSIRAIDEVRNAVQTFIISHECGHIYHGDLDDPIMKGKTSPEALTEMIDESMPVFYYRHQKEHNADRYALNTLLNSIRPENGLDILKLSGPFVFFLALDMVEQFIYFLTFREDRMDTAAGMLGQASAGLSSPSSHPTPFARSMKLRDEILEVDGLPEQFKNVVRFFADDVWSELSKARIEFQNEHKESNFFPPPHPRWQSMQVGFIFQKKFGEDLFRDIMEKTPNNDS